MNCRARAVDHRRSPRWSQCETLCHSAIKIYVFKNLPTPKDVYLFWDVRTVNMGHENGNILIWRRLLHFSDPEVKLSDFGFPGPLSRLWDVARLSPTVMPCTRFRSCECLLFVMDSYFSVQSASNLPSRPEIRRLLRVLLRSVPFILGGGAAIRPRNCKSYRCFLSWNMFF
jgi:hypothetical protein